MPLTLHHPDLIEQRHSEVAILGAGFAGICMAIRLRQQGHRDVVLYEKATSLGGTWRDNTYPGCGCDVPSHLYSLSFARNPDWSRTYAPQHEILAYLKDVATRYRLEEATRFSTEIVDLRWQAAASRWELTAADGRQFTAGVVISAMGGLHIPSTPALPGRDLFRGVAFHSARWRHDIDLTDKRVAVIGTGASAIQIVPEIAPRVAQVTVFQRTPAWILPRNDRLTTPFSRWAMRYVPGLQSLRRLSQYWAAEPIAVGFSLKPKALGSSQKRADRFMRSQIDDPAIQAQLVPPYSIGCKRVLLSDTFYPTLNRANVDLVTRPIAGLTPDGLVTRNGNHWPADVLIYATGFKPFNPTHQVRIAGRDGRVLADDWVDGPEAFKGVAVAGYPNFFMLMGPNSGLGHSSILLMIEAQVGYISRCLRWLKRSRWRGGPMRAIEVRPESQRSYNAWLQQRFTGTVWNREPEANLGSCSSWYQTASGKNYTLWPSFATAYLWAMRRPDPSCFFDATEQVAAPAQPPAGNAHRQAA